MSFLSLAIGVSTRLTYPEKAFFVL